MKRISKILSVLMVVAMLFSIAVIPASAEGESEFTIKYEFRKQDGSAAINSAKAGDIVRLYTIFNWDKRVCGVAGAYAWNTSKLTMYNKNGTAALAASAKVGMSYNAVGEFALSSVQPITDPDMAYENDNFLGEEGYKPYGMYTKAFNHKYVPAGWDADKKANYLSFTYGYTADPTAAMPLIDTNGEDMDVLYSYFYVKEDMDDLSSAILANDAELDDKIYIYYPNDQSFILAAMGDIVNDKSKDNNPNSYVAVPAAPSYDVYNLGGKNGEDAVKKSNDDGTYKIGTFFAFKAATIAPDFIEGNPDVNLNGKSENIEAITATITATKADGTTSTITADPIKYVYDVSAAKDKSELGFVVVINGIPNDDTSITSYTITPVMQTNDGKTYTCETLTVNVADLA